MLLFSHVDDTLQIESQFLALDFHENEWTKPMFKSITNLHHFSFLTLVILLYNSYLYHWGDWERDYLEVF